MVQILLLALAVSLAYAGSVDYSKVTGNWRTIAIAADDVEKIKENGELRAYIRQMECVNACEKISMRFFTKVDGVCTESTIVGTRRDKDGVYNVDLSTTKESDAGENTFQILCNSDDAMVISNSNMDENGKITKGVVIIAKRNFLTPEEQQKFVAAVQEKGVPTENIRRVIETDTCPE